MISGQCLCGGVRYRVEGSPLAMYHCHCSTCRRASGASFATNILVASADFNLAAGSALLSSFESSPGKRRHFCARCGSPIFSQSAQRPDRISVRCGTLDADPGVRPSLHAHVASKAAWTELDSELPCFPEDPG